MIWLKDARGRASVTLTFVAPAVAVLLFRFVVAGLTLGDHTFPELTGIDFGTAFAAIGGIWWGREHTDKNKRAPRRADDPDDSPDWRTR